MGACISTALNAVPWGKLFKAAKAAIKAIGIGRRLTDVEPGDTVLAGPASVADEDEAVAQSQAAEKTGAGAVALLPDAGAPLARQVTATITGHGTKHLVELTLVGAGSGGGGPPSTRPSVLTATDGHPLWTTEHGWTRAGTIQPGDHLIGIGDHTVRVAAVSRHTTVTTVHNLTVDDRHTYYVEAGNQTVLAHNCPSAGGAASNVTQNKINGDAFRDTVANRLENEEGFNVIGTEVSVKTPFGRRFIDILAERNGGLVAFETKLGGSRYHKAQRAKDWWIANVGADVTGTGTRTRVPTVVIRGPL